MGLFNRRINSEEYEKIKKEITDLHSEVTKLKTFTSSLESQLATLRGAINRKKYSSKSEDEEEDSHEVDEKEIRDLFGGDIPIELQGKYKNS